MKDLRHIVLDDRWLTIVEIQHGQIIHIKMKIGVCVVLCPEVGKPYWISGSLNNLDSFQTIDNDGYQVVVNGKTFLCYLDKRGNVERLAKSNNLKGPFCIVSGTIYWRKT